MGLSSCHANFVDPSPVLRGSFFFFFQWHFKAVQTITTWSFSFTRDSAASLPRHQLNEGNKKRKKFRVSCITSLLYLIDLFESVSELNLVRVAKFKNQLKFQFHAAFNIEKFIVGSGGG